MIDVPLSERSLIKQIRSSAPSGKSVITGIGDDCSVLRLPAGHDILLTTDFTLEDVHFRRDWHPPEVVGSRCLTRGLSDIAAMGGEPQAAFLSLALASDVPKRWIDHFLRGLLALAQQFNVSLAGGDTAQSPKGIQADIVVLGSVPKGQAILRSGARAGDYIYVTGILGGAAAALARLRQGKSLSGSFLRYIRPTPRLAVGRQLRRRKLPSAMIDLSDGLSTDLDHICEESGVGAEIQEQFVPRAPIGSGKHASLDEALHGGDDYELLFTSSAAVPPKVAGVRITRIGRITQPRGMRLIGEDGKPRALKPEGWEHFRRT